MRVFRLSESRPDPRRDVEEEIGFHLEMRAREFMERGLSLEDARRAAAASFGDVRAIENECAALRRHRARERAQRDWLVGLGLDVKVATRALWKRPAFAAAVITTLALGIGAAAAVFAIVAGVLLRPMPYRNPHQLVMVWLTGPDVRGPASQLPLSAPIYLDIQRGVRGFESIAAFRSWPYTLTDGTEPEQIMGVQASPALFATLGVRPMIGRALTDSDAVRGAPNVAVISDALWRRRYGADPGILGRPISLDAERFTVVGVAPREFAFPRGAELPSGLQFPTRTDIWTPIRFSDQDLANRFTLNLAAVARIRHGVTPAAANAEIREFGRRLDAQYLKGKGRIGMRTLSLVDQAAAPVRRSLFILLGAVVLVLVIACVNITNLLIARTAARGRELAVRAALGAGAARLARQLVTENVLLALIGATLGLLFATGGTRLMLALVPGQLPRADDVTVDWRVLLAAATSAVIAGSLFGLAAAVHARRAPAGLHASGARTTFGASQAAGRRLLVGAQIALSLVLLVGAGLLGLSFARLQRTKPGFLPEHVLTGRVLLPVGSSFDPRRDGPGWAALFTRLTDRLNQLPNVRAAGAVSALPLSGTVESAGLTIEGRPPAPAGQGPNAEYAVVSGAYFDAMGIKLLSGRAVSNADRADAPPVVVVSREFERRYFPNERAVGHRISGGFDFAPVSREIVGVVDDVRQISLDQQPAPAVYVPEAQMTYPGLTLVVRTKDDPTAVLPLVRRELHELAPTVALAEVRTLSDVLVGSLARQRFNLVLIGTFAAAAHLLAVVGLYGVIALGVGERRRELGVRLALGARPASVLRLVIGEGLRLTALGVAVGLTAAMATSRLLRSMLYEVSTSAPLVYVAAAIVVAIVAFVATLLPARGATKVDPMVVLRGE